MGRDVDRWAFLAGEGTLTAAEVAEWAAELADGKVALSGDIDPMTLMMVAVVPQGEGRQA